MKIYLPSSGILGLKVVEMRQPTFADLRSANSFNMQDTLFKYSFVKNLLPDGVDFSKMTYYDLEYLYTISAFSVQFNEVGFSMKCDCGKVVTGRYSLEGQELVDIKKYTLPHKVTISDVEYSYTILSAAQAVSAAEHALQEEDYGTAYEDACACFIFGKDLSALPWVKALPLSVYITAFLFQQANFHGISLTVDLKCPFCGREQTARLKVSPEYVLIDVQKFMNMYASVSDVLSFDAFTKFTIPEYKSYIDALNQKLR